jgi:LAO/AO transport system kinase
MEIQKLKEGILNGNVRSLSKAITLVESTKPEHRRQAVALIDSIYDQRKKTIRIGITGIPGVGKSSFIERLGMTITNAGLKLAVLAIDPSSSKTGGSILGDKTRMEELSREKDAFIRPSPSSGTLGGVAARTRESMLLCEAASFDVVIIETVGVGQSETEVIDLSDIFLMLAMPGTGDELQGIKRGIMEAADLIVINKADGENINAAKRAKKQLEIALHLFPASEKGITPKVRLASALNNDGVNEAWSELKTLFETLSKNGWLESARRAQQAKAFQKLTEVSIYEQVMQQLGHEIGLEKMTVKIMNGEKNEYAASLAIMNDLKALLQLQSITS